MTNRIKAIILSLIALIATASCIENDVPYPFIKLFVSDIKVEGQLGNAVINNEERTVTVNLADTVNLKKVKVLEVQVTDNGRCSLPADTVVDLTNSIPFTLSLYQDYAWTLKANQVIERLFKVKGQVGSASFTPKQRIASVNISTKSSLTEIELLELKLGPTGSTINLSPTLPYLTWEQHGNYATTKVMVNFRDFIVMEEWTLYVFQVESNVNVNRVDAWTNVAWLYGEGLEGQDNGFELREASATEWITVDTQYITHTGGTFQACVPHLKAGTEYVCRAYSGTDKTEEVTFTTAATATALPNAGFEEWHKSGKVWNPWSESGTPIWDSGNDGATTLGESITVPTDEVCPTAQAGTQAAQLSSKFVGLGSIGKFAAGNLFVGEYVRTDGTNGILAFGKPFTDRPTKLKGYYKYTTAPIDCMPANATDKANFADYEGVPDTCSIYIALGDWDSPVEIRTKPTDRKLFDRNDSHVIAYAELNNGANTDGYLPFELTLDYRATNREPRYLLIVATASKYGDYFMGGTGATLLIDEFELEYDY